MRRSAATSHRAVATGPPAALPSRHGSNATALPRAMEPPQEEDSGSTGGWPTGPPAVPWNRHADGRWPKGSCRVDGGGPPSQLRRERIKAGDKRATELQLP